MTLEERLLQERIEDYINNKINWSANKNTVIQAERGDVEQFAQDTFWEAWQQAKDHFEQQNKELQSKLLIEKRFRAEDANDHQGDQLMYSEAIKKLKEQNKEQIQDLKDSIELQLYKKWTSKELVKYIDDFFK